MPSVRTNRDNPQLETSNVSFVPMARELDDDAIQEFMNNPRKAKDLKLYLAGVADDMSEEKQKLLALVTKIEHDMKDNISPSTRLVYNNLLARWSIFLSDLFPHIPLNAHWCIDTIKECGKTFLPALLKATQGRDGQPNVRADTLSKWKTTFITLILLYAKDNLGQSCGAKYLYQGQFENYLSNQVSQLIREFKLERHTASKRHLGMEEAQLMIQECIKNYSTPGRKSTQVGIQEIVVLLVSFYTGFRPSTLGPGHKEYADRGLYPKLKEIRVYQESAMNFTIHFEANNFKKHNGDKGVSRLVVLKPVSRWQHVLQDVSLYFVLHLMLRGALVGINTLQELRANQNYEIGIKEDMKDQPLFLACQPGGRGFASPPQPMRSTALNDAYQNICDNAGMERMNPYSPRNEAASFLIAKYGKALAEMAFVHQVTGSLHHYIRGGGTGILDLVGDRNATIEDELQKKSRQLHELNSPAVTAVTILIDTKIQQSGYRTVSYTLTQEQKDEIELQPDVQALNLQIQQTLSELRLIRSESTSYSNLTSANLRAFIRNTEPTENSNEEEAEALVDKVITLGKQRTARVQILRMEARRALKRAANKRHKVLPGTTTQRRQALNILREPPSLIKEATAKASHTTTAESPDTSATTTDSTDPDTSAATESPTDPDTSTTTTDTMDSNDTSATTTDTIDSDSDSQSLLNIIEQAINVEGDLAAKFASANFIDCTEDDNHQEEEGFDQLERKAQILIKHELHQMKCQEQAENQESARDAKTQEEPADAHPVQGPAELQLEESKDDDGIDLAEVKYQLMLRLIKPKLDLDDEYSRMAKQPNGSFHCIKCAQVAMIELPASVKLRRNYSYSRIGDILRHLRNWHNGWSDLAVMSLLEDGTFKCPSCSELFVNEPDLRKHCIKDCKDKDEWNLKAESAKDALAAHNTKRKQWTVNYELRYLIPPSVEEILARNEAILELCEDEDEAKSWSEFVDFLQLHSTTTVPRAVWLAGKKALEKEEAREEETV